jgi:hypothetical protein
MPPRCNVHGCFAEYTKTKFWFWPAVSSQIVINGLLDDIAQLFLCSSTYNKAQEFKFTSKINNFLLCGCTESMFILISQVNGDLLLCFCLLCWWWWGYPLDKITNINIVIVSIPYSRVPSEVNSPGYHILFLGIHCLSLFLSISKCIMIFSAVYLNIMRL